MWSHSVQELYLFGHCPNGGGGVFVCVCVVQVVKGLCPHADLAIGDPDGLHLLQLLLNLLNLSSVLVMWLNSGSSFTISKA